MQPRERREKKGDVWYVHYASAGGVVVNDDYVLLVRKKDVPEIRLPKGHIEPGETREQAALREVTEESGYANLRIVADLGEMINTFQRAPDLIISRRESYFLMALDSNDRREQPADDRARFEVLWVPFETAEKLLTYGTERAFVRRAKEKLKELGAI